MEARKVVLFGGHGIGIANNKKQSWNYGSGTDLGQNWPRTVTIAMTCGADLAQIRESYFTSGAHLALVCDPYLGLIRPGL
ncbi:unnamed protein product [Boreogadus saida]